MNLSKITSNYTAPSNENWSGRHSNVQNPRQYWHESVSLIDLREAVIRLPESALLGYACDEGVRRNQGRVGAVLGPNAIRQKLGKLPNHFGNHFIADAGDVFCKDGNLEKGQEYFSASISHLVKNSVFTIGLGGGHDIAYANFNGLCDAVSKKEKKKIGIINFDAHFDLRPVEKAGNSGTPFNQILNEAMEKGDSVDYTVIGIQHQSNTKSLFDIAKTNGVHYFSHLDCGDTESHINAIVEKLADMIDRNDYLYISIDLDGFSSAFAPGVSAPSPLGFSPIFMYKMLDFLFDTKKVISCDIAELNPTFDQDGVTASLASRLVDFMVMKRLGIDWE